MNFEVGNTSERLQEVPELAIEVDALTAPESVKAEMERLEGLMQDDDADVRYPAEWFHGAMGMYRNVIVLQPADQRVRGLLGKVKESPRFIERRFVPAHELAALQGVGEVRIEPVPNSQPVELPLDNFVSAEGFVSWEQGRGESLGKVVDAAGGAKYGSSTVIENYAGMTSEAPPLESVVGYVQPNGIVSFVTQQGSHRTGAAILRGDQTIKAKALTLVRIGQNVFET